MKQQKRNPSLPPEWLNVLSELDQHLQSQQQLISSDEFGSPSDDKELSAIGLDSLLVELCRYQRHLTARAFQDDDSAAALYNFAFRTTKHLWQLANAQPEKVKKIAQFKNHFPCPLPAHRTRREQMIKMILQLGVGSRGSINLQKRKPFNPDLPANRYVEEWLKRIDHVRWTVEAENKRRQKVAEFVDAAAEAINCEDDFWKAAIALKPFCKSTVKDWLAVIWVGILRETAGKPEGHPILKELGQHRARHSYQIGQQSRVTSATSASNIRDGIRKRIGQILTRLASPFIRTE